MNKIEVLVWLDCEHADHEAMQKTINTQHPGYAGSAEETAWKAHERAKMTIEYLARLVEQQANP